MALSNWDTLALDQDGNPTSGSFVSPLGVEVTIYKNWLYVRDPKAWTPEYGYSEPTVMQVNSGELRYKDVRIVALRGPQEGVYAVVWVERWQEQAKGQPYKPPIVTGMLGIGVYGYEGEEWIGVQPESAVWFRAQMKGAAVPELFRALDWSKSRRFNQGDAFFAEKLGFDTPATAPGAADESVLMQALKSSKEGGDGE